ncbi:glycine cleavage system protein T [Haloprofundus marisrubri]|uniref:Probable aminomethyltransferase n=1 Tax=Haloprofundus marisrubri TaxID=1514971 RepID=A0A0W1R5G8_9EURY|nr:glycine cleavage system aminomethyltransferase GcvT [Haloprofundus marisrubri]KTG08492.1 glycine cleavage system protein T [Haloprofundus marisrubri]
MAHRKPPLREVHADRGAKFTGFGGWEMPVEFDSIRTEHSAVRDSAGIFDVSHMSEITVSGADATELMQRLTTNDVTALDPGDSQYSCITDESGVILDDTVVYALPEGLDDADAATPTYLFIPNAGHDEQMYERWTTHRDEWGLDATVDDQTEEWAMFAVQGPEAPGLVADAANEEILDLSRFEATNTEIAESECLVARTGYTGEDGFEVLCPWDDAESVWGEFDCQPCGLGARDTLRIEMGFLLSGEDFDPENEPRNPYEAGISFTVKLDTEFVGRDALERAKDEGVDERFVGVKLAERGIARHGYELRSDDGDSIGHVTSGTMSPTLGEAIALGYVETDYAEPETRVRVVVRGDEKRARIVKTPFLEDK